MGFFDTEWNLVLQVEVTFSIHFFDNYNVDFPIKSCYSNKHLL